MAASPRVVIPTKWNWGMTAGTTTLWRVAPPTRYPKTEHSLARGRTSLAGKWGTAKWDSIKKSLYSYGQSPYHDSRIQRV